jgi:hypothetical protein
LDQSAREGNVAGFEPVLVMDVWEHAFLLDYKPVRASKVYRSLLLKHGGLDQGPIVAMIENYRTGFFWELMRKCRYLGDGLRAAGFMGGWL